MLRVRERLRCATFKFSEETRKKIEEIRQDRMRQEVMFTGLQIPLTNTDILRFLIDQEIAAMTTRAAAAAAVEMAKQRKEVKLEAQRKSRAANKGGDK